MKILICALFLLACCGDSYVEFDTPVFSTKVPDGWKEKRNIRHGFQGEVVLTKTNPKRVLDLRWGSSLPRSPDASSELALLHNRPGTYVVRQTEDQLPSGAFATTTIVWCSNTKRQFTINTGADTKSTAKSLRDRVLSEAQCKGAAPLD